MSLIVTLHCEEGIVMASDSRVTFSNSSTANNVTTVNLGASQSDAIYKTFLTPQRFGISYCGDATVKGVPLAGFVEAFINEKLTAETEIDAVPGLLIDHFKTLDPVPDSVFHVAGYQIQDKLRTQKIWRVLNKSGQKFELVPTVQRHGIIWNGEMDVLTRILLSGVCIQEPNGVYTPLLHFGIPFESFTLQDMIDFAVYAIRLTADTMRFQLRIKSVGGPIDVLVIKPTEAIWIQRKQLKYNEA